jgi:hypothetical protein
MAHSTADVIQSRTDLTSSIHREISIYKGYLAALENVLRATEMLNATKVDREVEDLEEEAIVESKNIGTLAERLRGRK